MIDSSSRAAALVTHRLAEMLQKVVRNDVELYRNLLPLKGVMLHLE